MPSLLESVTSLLGQGDTLATLGKLMGGDEDQAKTATGLAVPAILGGIADTATRESGTDAVMGMLDNNSAVLDDLGGFLDRGEAEAGNTILDAVFGEGRADLVSALASKADMGGPLMGKLMPMLAPLVAGIINQRRTEDGLDAAGVGELLATEKQRLDGEGLLETVAAGVSGSMAAMAGAAAMAGVSGGLASAVKDGPSGDGGTTETVQQSTKDPGGAAADVATGAGDGPTDGAAGVAGAAAVGAAAAGGAAASAAAGSAADTAAAAATDTAAAAATDTAAAAASAAKGATTDLGKDKSTTPPSPPVDKPRGRGDDGGAAGALGWLWWALGAVVLVLLLAWLLSTCNDETAEAGNDTSAAETGADDQSADSDSDSGSDSGDADGDSEGDATDGSDGNQDLQEAVDAALQGSGVAGSVDGDTVTLVGTVDGQDAATAAEQAVAELSGVESVANNITIGGSSGDADSGSDSGEAESDSGDVAVDSGDTINELLDLDPVTFRVSSARITDAGQAVLDDAAAFLQQNSEVEIEIGGHTDNDGAEVENQQLSQLRADAVKAYLESKGIDGDRMTTKGYGESEPKVPNSSASAKAENRRIEFTIL